MKKIILIIASVLCLAALGYCQGQPLKLTIKTDKGVYEVGEEINVKCDLTNVSNKDIIVCVYGLGYPKMGVGLDLIDSKRNKVEKSWTGPEFMLRAPMKKDFKIIKPNESIPFIIKNLDFGYYSYILTEPGKYFITVYYSNDTDKYYPGGEKEEFIDAWIGTVVSNTIAIEVVETNPHKSIPK